MQFKPTALFFQPTQGFYRMTSPTIGPPAAEDRERLASLFFADMVDLGERPDQEALRNATDELLSREGKSHKMFVARDEEKTIIGVVFAAEFISIKFPGKALWIEELYVAPGYRRHGIGRQLVEHLLDWAEKHEFRGVELEAYRMNTGASILYRSLGFRRLPRERYAYRFSDEG